MDKGFPTGCCTAIYNLCMRPFWKHTVHRRSGLHGLFCVCDPGVHQSVCGPHHVCADDERGQVVPAEEKTGDHWWPEGVTRSVQQNKSRPCVLSMRMGHLWVLTHCLFNHFLTAAGTNFTIYIFLLCQSWSSRCWHWMRRLRPSPMSCMSKGLFWSWAEVSTMPPALRGHWWVGSGNVVCRFMLFTVIIYWIYLLRIISL